VAWGEGNVQDGGGEEGRGRNGWLSHGGRVLINRLNGLLQRVIGMFRLDLEADYRPDPQRPWPAMRLPADLKFQIVCCDSTTVDETVRERSYSPRRFEGRKQARPRGDGI